MEENILKSYFTSFIYLCKDFTNNYNEILTTFNIILSYLKGDSKELIEFFILDLSNINDYLNKKTDKFSVPIPDKFKVIEHYLNLYHNFIIKINWYCDNNISQNNKYFKDYLEFIEMSSDLLYYHNIEDNNKVSLLLLIYIPLYTAYII
jgi:hypothetical protein